jgi:hypothetical protein
MHTPMTGDESRGRCSPSASARRPSILIAAGNATTTGRAYAWDCAGPLISNCCNLIGTTDQPSIYLSHHCSYTADATDQAGDKRRSNRACFRWQRTVARPRQCRLAPRTPRSMRSRSAPSPWTGTTQLCPASVRPISAVGHAPTAPPAMSAPWRSNDHAMLRSQAAHGHSAGHSPPATVIPEPNLRRLQNRQAVAAHGW